MKCHLLIATSFCCYSFLHAQETKPVLLKSSQAVSGEVLIPVGNFSETHFLGISAHYNWYGNEFKSKSPKKPKFQFAANGGVSVFAGKNETVGSGEYRYPAFILVNAYGGISMLPSNQLRFVLTGGPALGIYRGKTSFNIGAKLSGEILFSSVAIGPSIQLIKQKESDPLWAGSLGLYFSL